MLAEASAKYRTPSVPCLQGTASNGKSPLDITVIKIGDELQSINISMEQDLPLLFMRTAYD